MPQGPAVDLYARECVICLDKPRHVRFQCGHSTLCQVGVLPACVRATAAAACWAWRQCLRFRRRSSVDACGLGGDLVVEGW